MWITRPFCPNVVLRKQGLVKGKGECCCFGAQRKLKVGFETEGGLMETGMSSQLRDTLEDLLMFYTLKLLGVMKMADWEGTRILINAFNL